MKIQRRAKPAPRNRRLVTRWTDLAFQKFLAYAEYLGESDDLDYAVMAMTSCICDIDVEFEAWLRDHPGAGEPAAKPKRQGKSKKSAEKAAA